MGRGMTLFCPKCRYTMELFYGGGFLSYPREETRQEVRDGVYGKRPKAVLEKYPDAECVSYSPLFHCSCGNYISKSAVVMHSGGKAVYRPARRCNLCREKMWEVDDVQYPARCPKCDTIMSETCDLLWD